MPIRIQSATLPYRTAASLILLIGCGDVGSSNANGTLPDGAAVLRFGDGGGRRVDIRHGRCHAATGNAYVDSISADRVSKRPERIAARSVSMV